MASTREILKALNKLEDDRKSDLLCSPDARREEYAKANLDILCK